MLATLFCQMASHEPGAYGRMRREEYGGLPVNVTVASCTSMVFAGSSSGSGCLQLSGYSGVESHGFLVWMPVSMKSLTLRVASSAFQLRQIAAICPSAMLIWCPVRSRAVTMSA
jgi:hypothetical protein